VFSFKLVEIGIDLFALSLQGFLPNRHVTEGYLIKVTYCHVSVLIPLFAGYVMMVVSFLPQCYLPCVSLFTSCLLLLRISY